MVRLPDASFEELKSMQADVRAALEKAKSLEQAAQMYTAAVYEHLRESIVLVRMFASIPYGKLPRPNQAFVDSLARKASVEKKVNDKTLVLSLLGSSGVELAWNDRRKSQGHVGIPLVSTVFVDAIPMMSRLLKQLGMGLDWIDSKDTEVVKRTMGKLSGMFYVPDATTEVDKTGRKIISAQDFVNKYQVKTVTGFGGSYSMTETFTITIVFFRDFEERSKADQLSGLLAFFNASTRPLLDRVFD